MWIALYARQIPLRYHQLDTPAKAPARGGGRALRGGAFRAFIPRIGATPQRPLQTTRCQYRAGLIRRKGLDPVI